MLDQDANIGGRRQWVEWGVEFLAKKFNGYHLFPSFNLDLFYLFYTLPRML